MTRNPLQQALLAVLLLALSAPSLHGVEVYSTSFEEGGDSPGGWRLGSGSGKWAREGRDGSGCLTLTGTGEGSGMWRYHGVVFAPSRVYRLSCYLRQSADRKTGPVPVGSSFAKRDYFPNAKWGKQTMVFRSPDRVPKDPYLYFAVSGFTGTAWCDDMALEEAAVRHRTQDGITLGIGEKIENGTYTFQSQFTSEFSNLSRVGVEHTVDFHSTRHWFHKDEYAVQKYDVAGCPQISANVKFHINYYIDGECILEASKDGKTWRKLGAYSPVNEYGVDLPPDLFPSDAIFLRFTGTGNFQIDRYVYTAKLKGSPPNMEGATEVFSGRYISADSGKLRLQWHEHRPELVSIHLGDRLIGSVCSAIAQFEKKGIGYKGTGIGSVAANNVKSVTLKTKEPTKCVVDVVVERTESEETMRRFDATYRFTLYAGQPWFESRLISVKNTDTIGYRMVGYYHRLQPPEGSGVRPICYRSAAAWIGEGDFLGALMRNDGDFTLAFRRDNEAHGDITRSVEAQTSPGFSWQGEEPSAILFAGRGGEKEFGEEMRRIEGLLGKAESEYASGSITYAEEKQQ